MKSCSKPLARTKLSRLSEQIESGQKTDSAVPKLLHYAISSESRQFISTSIGTIAPRARPLLGFRLGSLLAFGQFLLASESMNAPRDNIIHVIRDCGCFSRSWAK